MDAKKPSPWHAGEVEMHASLGVAEQMATIGHRAIRDCMTLQQREFFESLRCVFIGYVDEKGQPWASILVGTPGFVSAPTAKLLRVQVPVHLADPLSSNLAVGNAIGVLGIEIESKRRNRANGVLEATSDDHFDVRIGQAYGNCPSYIHQRTLFFVPPGVLSDGEALGQLDGDAVSLIRAADTFFVASYAESSGAPDDRAVDVSHRGGRPGFIHVDGNCLTIPDYAGNHYFNTLGNILSTGRAGLLFVDFNNGDLLHLTGRASLVEKAPALASAAGAERYWQVQVDAGVRRRAAINLRTSQ